jgi:hypothetical protein
MIRDPIAKTVKNGWPETVLPTLVILAINALVVVFAPQAVRIAPMQAKILAMTQKQ